MIDRRSFLTASAAGLLATGAAPKPGSLGVVIHSYPIRGRVEKGFADPFRFLDFCRERGGDGVQLPLGARTPDEAAKLRAAAEKHGMYLEGSVRPPNEKIDLDRFDAEIRTARDAGATVVRTVMLGGRRYETFRTAEQFTAFEKQALASLRLAEPVMARHKVTLAVENHKEYRSGELADVMKAVSSEFVGVCFDTGNDLALLEHPLDTAKALAPWAAACHLKDMGVEEFAEGFLLAEVPLGDGFLDLGGIVGVLRKARPAVRFSLEMITRDPLRIPCLTDGYWPTLDRVPGRDLGRTLATVRKHPPKQPLPRVSQLPEPEQLAVEDRNVRRSLEYARAKLGL